MKKAQSSTEYLITFGFAMFVVIGAIAVLSYTNTKGSIDPPSVAMFPPGFASNERPIINSKGTIKVGLMNNIGDIQILDIGFSGDEDCADPNSVDLLMINGKEANISDKIEIGKSFVLQWDCGSLADKDKFESELTFTYRTESGLTKSVSGNVKGKIS